MKVIVQLWSQHCLYKGEKFVNDVKYLVTEASGCGPWSKTFSLKKCLTNHQERNMLPSPYCLHLGQSDGPDIDRG